MKKILKKYTPNIYNMFKEIYFSIKEKINYTYLINADPKDYQTITKHRYKQKTGKNLDFDNLNTYTEKMQYAKLYLNTPLKTKLADKYAVREWVSNKIGDKYLIPLIGVWDNYADINFDELPNKFVFKANHGASWNLIVKDKKSIEHKREKIKFDKWMSKNFAFSTGTIQLQYRDIKPRIIVEKYIEDSKGELNDYKFLCFNGKVYYCWIDVGRYSNHYRNVYDLEWQLQPWNQHTYENTPFNVEKPENFEEMIEVAKILCQGFSHVRVDLYNVDGKIYFGEMTFTNGSGHELIYPEQYDYNLGELWNIKDIIVN